ncbi:MAG: hypothetical protein NC913_05355 [Candidatus Omnitrophica bacterium]|nr:hypothetical protein [Candidatus Omnitrophota bacterium]
MQELSMIESLRILLKNVCERENAKKVISIEMTVHPYSCLDEDNLNFMYLSILGDDPILKDAKIKIKRSEKVQQRQFIVNNIEIEVD